MDALVTVITLWKWMLWSPNALQTPTLVRLGDGCSGHRKLSKHERYSGLGMDALVTKCSRNMHVLLAWAWRLWSKNALETRTFFMAWVCGRAKALENPRQNMHRGPTTM